MKEFNMQYNVKVYLVDDHAVVREGYKHLLEKAQIDVIAQASSGEQAYRDYELVNPDVMVIDLSMEGIGGIETIRRITSKNKSAKILAFSMHDDTIFATRAIQAGATGYVTKSSAPDVLVEAVFAVASNKRFISQDIANKISLKHINPEPDDINKTVKELSAREFEVFQLLAKGKSLDEIAQTVHLDYKTIANAQTRLKQKLKVDNTAQLILAAIKLNILVN
jgi:two-component system invasion response regulator UvrY